MTLAMLFEGLCDLLSKDSPIEKNATAKLRRAKTEISPPQDPSRKSSVASLYGQYESYCRTQNKHPRTKVQFGNALKSQGYAQVRDNTGRYWQGLSTFHDENDNNDKVSINLCQSLSWATFQIPCHSCHLCHSTKGHKYIYPLVMNTGSDSNQK